MTDEQIDAITTALSLIGLSGDPRVRGIHKTLRTLLSASKPAVPEGWKLVPVEPTVEMQENGSIASDYDCSQNQCARIYRAMLAAAPAAPAQSLSTDDERAALPRYTEWRHLREHGQWSNGVPTWARDHNGQMSDFIAATAVIEELAVAQPTNGGNRC